MLFCSDLLNFSVLYDAKAVCSQCARQKNGKYSILSNVIDGSVF